MTAARRDTRAPHKQLFATCVPPASTPQPQEVRPVLLVPLGSLMSRKGSRLANSAPVASTLVFRSRYLALTALTDTLPRRRAPQFSRAAQGVRRVKRPVQTTKIAFYAMRDFLHPQERPSASAAR